MIFLMALIGTVIGIVPLLLCKKWSSLSIMFPLSFLTQSVILYLGAFSMVWPMLGVPGLLITLMFILDAIIISFSNDSAEFEIGCSWVVAILILAVYAGLWIGSFEMFNATTYSSLIGQVENRQWTQDIQPKDPNHVRLVSEGNATFLAIKAMGQDGAIGSQYHLGDPTLQLVKGELWYAFPLEYDGLMVANSTGSIPGYVIVSAENPDLPARFVKFNSGSEMVYSPSAYFSNDLERHLRENGYLNKGLMDFSFELDENYHPWWVVSVFTPTVSWSGYKVDGVVVVDPTTGNSTYYSIGRVPQWIDRVIPERIVNSNISFWGDLKNGWWNTSIFGSKVGRVVPGDTILIYGNNGDATWVTDVASTNKSDNSIVGLVYTDAHTGKSVYYHVSGGGTNKAVVDNVNNSQDILFRKLTGVDPQLYNLYGEMVDIIPVVNNNSAFQGVAIVAINNIQQIAYGPTITVAMAQFEKSLANNGSNTAINKDRILHSLDGIIDRIGFNNTNTGTVFYFHINGVDHLFSGDISKSIKLPVTRVGDKIKITYYDSLQSSLPIHDFDNVSLLLNSSSDQQFIEKKNSIDKHSIETHEDAITTRSKLNNMSDDQLQHLIKK